MIAQKLRDTETWDAETVEALLGLVRAVEASNFHWAMSTQKPLERLEGTLG